MAEEKIKYYVFKEWSWDCVCGCLNELDTDPAFLKKLICDGCGKEFIDFEEE